MKILQLTSFTGNSGDSFAHAGFQVVFREYFSYHSFVEFTEANIRSFYKNSCERYFDADFAAEINQHDAFVIGNGLHFDVRWDYSATGTTLNFSREFIDSIKIPVIMNGLSYAEPRNCDSGEQQRNFEKFKDFIVYIAKKPNWMLTLRNDGSYERMCIRFGVRFANHFLVVPDSAFYFDTSKINPLKFETEKRTIGICLANDSFSSEPIYEQRKGELNRGVADFIKHLLAEDCRIILFAHMPRDLDAIHGLYLCLGESPFRHNVIIAPYNNLEKLSASTLASYYKACHCVLATRFHAAIIPIICKVPVIGLAAESLIVPERIVALYKNLGLSEFCLQMPMEVTNIAEQLYLQYEYTMDNAGRYLEMTDKVMKAMKASRIVYFAKIKELIDP